MHEGKTECMLFGTGYKLALSTSFSIVIDRKALNRVSEYKYLAIVLDASLTWNAHVGYLIGKVRKRLAMLGRIRKNINMYTAGTVYTSFVLPILDYCDIVWSCCGRRHVLCPSESDKHGGRDETKTSVVEFCY